MSIKIKLTNGGVSLIDNDDYNELSRYNWRLNKTGYATRLSKSISMARVIMGAKKGEYVDHINRDKLDNRKINLRITTNQQNNWNKKFKPGKSGYLGVRKKGKKYQAHVSNNYKQICLGVFNNAINAARAYDEYIIKTRGEYGVINKY